MASRTRELYMPTGQATSAGTDRPPCRYDIRHTAAHHRMPDGYTARPVKVSGRTGHWHRDSVARCVAHQIPFTTHGSLSGRWVNDSGMSTGSLPDEYADKWRDDVERFGYVFTVYSYSTPIAWITPNGTHIPDTRYSVTTTRHQGSARLGIAFHNAEYPEPSDWHREGNGPAVRPWSGGYNTDYGGAFPGE